MRVQLAQQAQEILGQSDLVIITERVDDVALLIGQMVTMGLPEVLDRHIPRHWTQRGLSWGWTAVIWLAYIVTAGDHRKVSVETGKFHIPRKVGNSFLGQGTVFRHCSLCRSLYLRLWLTRRPCVRLFLRATRARSVPVLFRSGVRLGLCLRACRAQSADDYAHMRTVPASPDPLAHGRSPAAVAERS